VEDRRRGGDARNRKLKQFSVFKNNSLRLKTAPRLDFFSSSLCFGLSSLTSEPGISTSDGIYRDLGFLVFREVFFLSACFKNPSNLPRGEKRREKSKR
jgi:hypothetical protein